MMNYVQFWFFMPSHDYLKKRKYPNLKWITTSVGFLFCIGCQNQLDCKVFVQKYEYDMRITMFSSFRKISTQFCIIYILVHTAESLDFFFQLSITSEFKNHLIRKPAPFSQFTDAQFTIKKPRFTPMTKCPWSRLRRSLVKGGAAKKRYAFFNWKCKCI